MIGNTYEIYGQVNNKRRQTKDCKDKEEEEYKLYTTLESGQTIDGKGRGVFATRDIKKGEMIFNGELELDHLIKHEDGQSYRKFVHA